MAYGLLGLKPWEFWKLTHAELLDMLDGYQYKADIEMHRIAWHAANVMNVHLKRSNRVTVDKLLGKKREMTLAEKHREFEKLKRLIKNKKKC